MTIQEGIIRSTRQALDDARVLRTRSYPLRFWAKIIKINRKVRKTERENLFQAARQVDFAIKELGGETLV